MARWLEVSVGFPVIFNKPLHTLVKLVSEFEIAVRHWILSDHFCLSITDVASTAFPVCKSV